MDCMGSRIRELRKAKNLTIDEVSRKLGISSSFLGLIERGKRSTVNENVMKLCNIFNVPFEYLAFGKDDKRVNVKQSELLSNISLNDDELRFLAEAAKTAVFYHFGKDELELLTQGLEIHARSINRVKELAPAVSEA